MKVVPEWRRAPNFTSKEVEALINCLELKPELIGPVKTSNIEGEYLTTIDRRKLWDEVAEEINRVGGSQFTGVVRAGKDVKKKWNDTKSRVKIKAEDIKSGKLTDIRASLSLLEERILQLIEKTGTNNELNSALPPAYFNVTKNSAKAIDVDASSAEIYHADAAGSNPTFVQTIPKLEPSETYVTMPHITGIGSLPILSYTTALPIQNVIPSNTGCQTSHENSEDKCASCHARMGSSNQKATNDLIQTLSESQNELKKEVADLKNIMLKISEQKRKRIEQESQKMDLKKIKLALKCQKYGIDYADFVSDFL